MFHKYGNFEGCISGANTVSSNRSFSYAIFKRRIHDALTTRFVFKNSFIFFLFILLLLLFYIYIPRAKAIYYHQYGPSDVFFSPFLYYIYFFFFSSPFVTDRNISSFFESKRTIWLTRRPCSLFFLAFVRSADFIK